MAADADTLVKALGERLCPWLRPAFERLESARIQGRLGHAWLLAGPAGVGKLNLALVMARRLLEEPPEGAPPPLEAAEAAGAMANRHVPADHHPDLHWIFPEEDRKTISIDQVRDVIGDLGLKSLRGTSKVVIIEPAETMTSPAANALLKTLEEPTPDTFLWLLTDQPGRLPPTLRSRCQILNLAPPPAEVALAWAGARTPAEPDILRLLEVAQGAPLKLVALLESNFQKLNKELEKQLILISQDNIEPDVVAEGWAAKKMDLPTVLDWLILRLRLAIRARMAPNASKPVTVSPGDPLHNAWQALALPALFGQLEAAETLREQQGSGINVELAARVLLLGFQPNRG